ncbi:SH3 domain-containing protein [Streptomyces sp. FXY-T5]|uniref:SH3 domain-containing protein n=1 Tax=Streptomyces sp. FXY-T5 TaxID=3064901 RepID=UPI00359C37A7
MTIRSKAGSKSTALGVLYKSHKVTVSEKSGNWLYVTDKKTDVKGWVSGTLDVVGVLTERFARICLCRLALARLCRGVSLPPLVRWQL